MLFLLSDLLYASCLMTCTCECHDNATDKYNMVQIVKVSINTHVIINKTD